MRVPRGLPNDVTHHEAIDICLIGRGALTCRYLGRFRCLKHTVRAGVIDDRVKTGKMLAAGDNCEGKRP